MKETTKARIKQLAKEYSKLLSEECPKSYRGFKRDLFFNEVKERFIINVNKNSGYEIDEEKHISYWKELENQMNKLKHSKKSKTN